eukprot:scaffold93351_cov63-Phaeocystis_antarctica.AAC.3
MAGRHHRASEALGRGRRPGVLQLRSDRRRGEQLGCSTYVPGYAYQPPVPYVRATHTSLLRTVRAPGGWPLYVRRTRTRCSPPEHLVASGSVGSGTSTASAAWEQRRPDLYIGYIRHAGEQMRARGGGLRS